ncbi:unnamed protein product [Cuscuta campestris]|uniref:Integrase catalytic domain-containing protein n=1 Tax=Cuscuta campestris TaxID=132261 RepID=A0A484L3L7_9ASTE|nr:unnamed protein product [Cuscuta campestris]
MSFLGGSAQPSTQIPTPIITIPTPIPSTSPIASFPMFPPPFPGPIDPMYSQAFQNFGQFMSMFQQTGGFFPFIPGLYPQSVPQTNIIRPVVPTNLIGEMDKVGCSWSRRSRSRRSHTQITPDGDVRSVHSKDEDWDVPQAQKKLKGNAVQPEGSRRSAFQRLGHDGRNQNRPAKEQLGVETTPVSAFDHLGRGAERPGRTRRTEPPPHDEPQNSQAPREEEAESHPRHTVRSHIEQPWDHVGRVEARLEKLQRWVARDEKKKILLNESLFTDRVHETPFPKKAKLEVPKFTRKDPEIHTLHGWAAEWFHNLPAGEINSFDELAEVFQEKFKENCTKRKKFTYLSTAGQREHEDLTKFLTLWKDEVDKVEEVDDKTAMSLLYADAKAQVSSKREAEQGHTKGRISLKKEIEMPGRVKAEVMEVKPVKVEKKPVGEKQWTEKYCSLYKTDSHNTAECNSVKGVIKQMIEAGDLDPEYLAQAKPKKNQWVKPEEQPAEQNKKKKAAGKEHLQGSILLTCELGMGDKVIQKQMRFVVVNIKCVHNAILGRPGINKVRGIISMAHLCMKFYTPGGIGQVRGDEKKARSCYLEAVKKMTKAFERVTLVSQEEDRSKLEPGDETEQIVLQEAFPEKMVRIGRNLPRGLREEIISVLREYADIFSWSVANMPGIDHSVICHRLAVIDGSRPVKQKKRHLANVQRDFVKKEVKDLLSVNREMEIKEERLARYSDLVRALLRELEEFRLTRIPRSENTDADMLSKLMQACPKHVSKLAKIEILDQPSAYRFEVVAIQQGQSSSIGINIIGAFPVAQGGKNIIVWQCEKFVWKNIVTRFGAPKMIVTDYGPQFRNPWFTAYLASFGIKHSKESVAYPQGNGQVENANRTIVDGLKKRLGEEGRKWLEALPHTMWALRVTSRRATRETPFVLTYGCESRLPIEAEFPTFRETVYQPGQNVVDHLAELNLVEERRTMAAVKMAGYQQSVKRYHDNRVGPRYFQVHDEVLRRRDASKPNERGKLVRNWEGPYRIRAIIRPGTYQLETMEGGRVDRHWNSHHLRKFFR